MNLLQMSDSPKQQVNTIILMEDDDFIRCAMKTHIEKISNYKVLFADDISAVIEFCKDDFDVSKSFILDVNMGAGRGLEGLEVLREIKQINSKAFVAIHTALVGNPTSFESVGFQARKYGADCVVEKQDIREDCTYMLAHINTYTNYRRKQTLIDSIFSESDLIEREQKEQEMKSLNRQDVNYLEKCLLGDGDKDHSRQDINQQSYELYQGNDTWVTSNKDYYVAFIDGELLEDKDLDKARLLARIRKIDNYQDKERLIIKVNKSGSCLDIIDEPTSTWLEII
jgi:CheY-like chemotaxis protein